MRLLLLLLFAGLSLAGVHVVPLVWHESKMRRMIREGTWADYLEAKQLAKAELLKTNPKYRGSFPEKVRIVKYTRCC